MITATQTTTLRALEEIATAIDLRALTDMSPALMTGRSGIALFYAYYYRLTGQAQYLDKLGEQVTRCLEDLSAQHPGFDHCNGLAGIAWALQHLVNRDMAEAADFEELLTVCDQVLGDYMEAELAESGYDFLHEGLGAVLYFIERMPQKNAAACLAKAVRYLDGAADKGSWGIRWQDLFTRKEKGLEDKVCYNLGLAHGIPALLNMLCLIYGKGVLPETTKALIQGGIQWLSGAGYTKPNDVHALYPAITDAAHRPLNPAGSRLGWCYGDLCIAHTLLHAGSQLKQEAYKAKAYALLEHILVFRDKENGSIADACFCHGSAGIAQMYRRAYLQSGRNSLQKGADFWLLETLGMQHETEGAAGFLYYTHQHKEPGYALLDGLAGIGLTLIASLDDAEASSWDRCFLLS